MLAITLVINRFGLRKLKEYDSGDRKLKIRFRPA